MILKIKALIKDLIYPKIIQFSPISSGSTLVFNLLRETYSFSNIFKEHEITRDMCSKYKTVVTYRNPVDCVASAFQRSNLPVTEENIEKQINELKNNGLDHLVQIFDHPNIIKLRYENFYDDFDFIFDAFESYFGRSISEAHRAKMKEKYSINNVLSEASKYEDFSEYDKITLLHGNHISKFKGKPNYSKHFFTEIQFEEISNHLSKYMNKLGY